MLDRETDRREVLATSLTVIGAFLAPVHVAAASTAPKLFAGTVLADNPLAARFEAVPSDFHLPRALLQTTAGNQPLSSLRSPATLVTLWAEFCAPCLMEMPDLAHLGDRYRASGFNVVALHLGGSMQAAKAKLASINAPTIPCWNDPQAQIATALATPPGAKGFTLPCNVLVDSHGRVRGRVFGARSLTEIGTTGRALTAQDKQQLMRAKSAWSLPVADQFAKALAGGLLNRI